MAKKLKTGSIELPASEFDPANAVAHISIRLPLLLVDELRKLALTEKYRGRYQTLIKDVLHQHVEKQRTKSKTQAG